MSFLANVSGQVSRSVAHRGQEYFQRGAVRVLEGSAAQLCATVHGGGEYEVNASREGSGLLASCTCPYFETTATVCKHVWAALLVAEKEGFLGGADATPPRTLEPDASDPGRDPEVLDFERGAGDPEIAPAQAAAELASTVSKRRRARGPRAPSWRRDLAAVLEPMSRVPPYRRAWHPGREVRYAISVPRTLEGRGIVLEVLCRDRRADLSWGNPKPLAISSDEVALVPDPADRAILGLLGAADRDRDGWWDRYDGGRRLASVYTLPEPVHDVLVPRVCATGRCGLDLEHDAHSLDALAWDDGEPWDFHLEVGRDPAGKTLALTGWLRRAGARMALAEPVLLVAGGLLFTHTHAARLRDHGAFRWISMLRQRGKVSVPAAEADRLLSILLGAPRLPPLDLPEELRFEEVTSPPRFRLTVRSPKLSAWGQPRLAAGLSFDYAGTIVPDGSMGQLLWRAETRQAIRRDADAETAARTRLHALGFRPQSYPHTADEQLELAPAHLPRAVKLLVAEGWQVEADGKLYRTAGVFRLAVSTGIDWFELHGAVEFGDRELPLPQLLQALRKGETTVQLGDGTFGVVPEAWLKKYGLLAGSGEARGEHVRFGRAQAGLLDALLATQPESTCDALFARIREELRSFEGVMPADAGAGFSGGLRTYQREGLGWLLFLERFGLGGCLADDMGLGKTVQVLALLSGRRGRRGGDEPRPTLVVAPRSVVFHWINEVARFAPALTVLDHTGIGRAADARLFAKHDLVVTTYGTLRRDIVHLKDIPFDYCVLDEAQTIKNADTDTAKAARLLQARHRLALSGTPIENHLGELWSLFEFLNPGMLGSAAVFERLTRESREPDPETRALLARALRPFLLRRTKEAVAKDLPEKLQETLWTDLEGPQRKLYDELRDHYRGSLLRTIDTQGIARSKIQILEALLRLRQAACHPGLIDKQRAGEPSAKLDALVAQLEEVREGGHKALVFSQFTSLLALVRNRLDRDRVRYEYLDGRTRDREARVRRFQEDPGCLLFLVSLKAGGLGLNLTAAEYVFLLDPWWNPAVEAQAIDRAHRIGQTRRVFAYRIIARNTIEERVLELQQSKRDLADAIIGADAGLLRRLDRQDLEQLLS